MLDFILAHQTELGAILGAILGALVATVAAAKLISKLTPTPKDDELVAKVEAILKGLEKKK